MSRKISVLTTTIYDLLINDKIARTDDVYLYKKVMEKLTPNLLRQPFEQVLTRHFDNGFIHFENVRRVRAKIQSEHPELVDKNTYKRRKRLESSYIKSLFGES